MQAKLVLGFAAIVVLLLLVATIAYLGFVEVRASQRRLLERNFAAVISLAHLRANLNAERQDVSLMMDVPRADWGPWREDLIEREREDDELIRKLTTLLNDDPVTRELMKKLAEDRAAFAETRHEQVLGHLDRGDIAGARALYLGVQTERHLALRQLCGRLEASETAEAEAIVKASDQRAALLLRIIIGSGAVALLGAAVVGILMHRALGAYIADRNRAEDALRRNAEFLRETQEITHIGAWDFEVGPQKLRWTDEVRRIHEVDARYEPGDLGRVVNFYVGESRDRMTTALQRATTKGEPYDLELTLRTAKGRNIWVRSTGKAEWRNGKVVRVYGNVVDITERKVAEERIKAERQRFNDVLNRLPAYVVLLSPDYGVPFANRYFEERFGVAKGRRCYEYLFNRTAPCEVCESFKPLKSGTPHKWDWIGPDAHHYEVYDFPFRDVDGAQLILEMGIDVTVAKKATDDLERANAYNRSLIEASVDALVTIGADGRITDANPAAELATGRTRAELIGTDFADYFTEPEKGRAAYERSFREGVVRDYPLHLQHRDGRVTPVLYNVSVYRDRGGAIAGVFAAARDISALKQAEMELRGANRALRATTGCNQAIVHAPTESELMQRVCDVIVEHAGYRMAWIGLAIRDEAKTVRPLAWAGQESGYLGTSCFTWADNEYGRGPTGTCIRTGRPAICRDMLSDPRFAPWRAEARKRGYASSIVLPLIIEAQTIGAISIYATESDAFDTAEAKWLNELAEDVSFGVHTLRLRAQQAEAEEALQQANVYNRSLIEASLDPLVTIGADGRILDVNTATEAATGRTREELIGTDFSDYFTDPKRARDGYHEVFERGLVRDYLLELKHRDGAVVSVLYNAAVVRDTKGRIIGVFAAARDITERKRAEEELRRFARELKHSNEELERFAYVASHDLQEPLRTVSSFSQLLARRYDGRLGKDADEFIAFIVSGAARMQTLINDLLAFSRVGTRAQAFEPVEADTVLNFALANLEAAIAETHAAVTHDPLPRIMADKTQVAQVFQNLIGNAIKFRQPDTPPRIHVAAVRKEQEWEFSVRDNGIGIEPQYFERIFVIFQRLHGLDQYPGTGIGLAICKKIVERHGGRIRVESTPGHGATFFFTLPDANHSP